MILALQIAIFKKHDWSCTYKRGNSGHFSYHQLIRHVPIPGSFGSRSPAFSNFEDENHTNWKKSSMQVSICAKIVPDCQPFPIRGKWTNSLNLFFEPTFLPLWLDLNTWKRKLHEEKNLSGTKLVSTNYTFTILARKPGIIFWWFWLWV